MKIAYLSTFYPYRGGIAQTNALLFRQLEVHHNVKAFTFQRQYPTILFPGTSQYVDEADKSDKIPAIRIVDSINPFSYYSAAKIIANEQPDLLLMRYWMPFFAPSLGIVARLLKKRGIKILSILDNLIPHEQRPGDFALTRFFLRQQDGVITMSETVLQSLVEFKIPVPSLCQFHPITDHFAPPVDQTFAREKLGLPKDKKILLFFGFIRQYKGLDIALEALQYLHDKDYALIIAGEIYGDFSSYQKIIDIHGLEGKIYKFIRYISDTETPLFFSAADLVVLPYKSATQSAVLSVAYHYEKPVVVTDVGELRRSVEPYQTGLVCPTPTPELFAMSIEEFFVQKGDVNFQQNIRLYNAQHSWENFADGLLSFARTL